MILRGFVAATALSLAVSAGAQEAATPITIGQSHILAMAGDDGARAINVFLPQGYENGEDDYPVLYLLDGGINQDFLHISGTAALNALWGRSQPAIIVGITSRDRRAELIGSAGNAQEREAFPTAGNAAAFRTFVRDKVKPLIEAEYRTNGTDVILGESLAGLFIVETWLTEPDLFDAYGAVNPSLWWGDQALARSARDGLGEGHSAARLLLSFSNEGPETQHAIEMVAEAAGDSACLLATPELTHATAYHILSPAVLQYLLPTEYEFEPEWGFTVPCAGQGAAE
ncbi:alpha/beta hydrolase [Aurantiacibacter rhizosphaerae]|uniref:Alpha/beta hydrolase n=1 Tax=Aurantiacibacter rhizosphaerae TaxID=2691582 RepID=A0A844XFJ7_9SPHN|nr:alpha/beta hydrolase-fold protein [Aurantiacibacter rhizosphaerae]MWV29391.1 alpha/beta hydrolase [Aurantiacibacter rhizosphaerae]